MVVAQEEIDSYFEHHLGIIKAEIEEATEAERSYPSRAESLIGKALSGLESGLEGSILARFTDGPIVTVRDLLSRSGLVTPSKESLLLRVERKMEGTHEHSRDLGGAQSSSDNIEEVERFIISDLEAIRFSVYLETGAFQYLIPQHMRKHHPWLARDIRANMAALVRDPNNHFGEIPMSEMLEDGSRIQFSRRFRLAKRSAIEKIVAANSGEEVDLTNEAQVMYETISGIVNYSSVILWENYHVNDATDEAFESFVMDGNTVNFSWANFLSLCSGTGFDERSKFQTLQEAGNQLFTRNEVFSPGPRMCFSDVFHFATIFSELFDPDPGHSKLRLKVDEGDISNYDGISGYMAGTPLLLLGNNMSACMPPSELGTHASKIVEGLVRNQREALLMLGISNLQEDTGREFYGHPNNAFVRATLRGLLDTLPGQDCAFEPYFNEAPIDQDSVQRQMGHRVRENIDLTPYRKVPSVARKGVKIRLFNSHRTGGMDGRSIREAIDGRVHGHAEAPCRFLYKKIEPRF